ncbi:MAG: hypothetical protein KatS3mg111_2794 [Pirellulaceae bacterium]|nr:MAG: hypothetical protein KatS3mg111_2794 [Pirellulaceae bacterium]
MVQSGGTSLPHGSQPSVLGQLTPDEYWDVVRYVLEDPTLDRDAFESWMLEDELRAVSVAEMVEHLAVVAAAATSRRGDVVRLVSPVGGGASRFAMRRRWWPGPALVTVSVAAALLLAVAAVWWVPWAAPSSFIHSSQAADDLTDLTEVALAWAALEEPRGASEEEEGQEESVVQDVLGSGDAAYATAWFEGDFAETSAASTAELDWIMEAQEFFATDVDG